MTPFMLRIGLCWRAFQGSSLEERAVLLNRMCGGLGQACSSLQPVQESLRAGICDQLHVCWVAPQI